MTQDTTINSELKGRRLTYYDLDKQRTRTRRFSQIEHANQVFDTIEDILLENDLAIRNGGQNKWVSSGCDEHDDSYFMVEVEGDIIDVDVIHEIEEALEVLHTKS